MGIIARNRTNRRGIIGNRIRARRRKCPPALARVGFFHFGSEDQSDPIGSLRASLREKSPVDSLIVVPEAFNICNGYWMPTRRFDFSIAKILSDVSKEYGLAFVAGLIEEDERYSSAFLIDGDLCRRLSRLPDPLKQLGSNFCWLRAPRKRRRLSNRFSTLKSD